MVRSFIVLSSVILRRYCSSKFRRFFYFSFLSLSKKSPLMAHSVFVNVTLSRLLKAKGVNPGIHHVMLEIGPSRLMVGDLWTLLPPHVAVQHSSETNSMKDFVGGWLVDKVVCS